MGMNIVEWVDGMLKLYDARVPQDVGDDSAKAIVMMRHDLAELIVEVVSAWVSGDGGYILVRTDDLPAALERKRPEMLYNAAMRMGGNPHVTGDDLRTVYELIGKELKRFERSDV